MNKHPPPLQCLAPSHCRRETGDPQITSLPHSEGLNGFIDIDQYMFKGLSVLVQLKKCHSRTWHRAKTNWCTDHGINYVCVFVFCVPVCLCVYVQLKRPFSIARLCSLSLYLVKVFLSFGSFTVLRYSANAYSLFSAR